jgi:hypothetical protein
VGIEPHADRNPGRRALHPQRADDNIEVSVLEY